MGLEYGGFFSFQTLNWCSYLELMILFQGVGQNEKYLFFLVVDYGEKKELQRDSSIS